MAFLPGYRPNTNRSIYVHGEINTSLVRSLTPKVLALQHENREPITVYIDSPGGSPQAAINLIKLLRAPSQNDKESIQIVTVAVTEAYSAAADLLAFGDYALAFPHSRILFHGGRMPSVTELTAERSSFWANILRTMNENSAMDLAREIQLRFMLRFVSSRGQFDGLRAAVRKPQMSDLDCFYNHIFGKVSSSAEKILKKARSRYGRYEQLVAAVMKARRRIKTDKTSAEIEAIELKAIVDFEVKQNSSDADWGFQEAGIESLADDFLLLKGYEDVLASDRYRRLCARYGTFLVDDAEAHEIESIPDEAEKLKRWTERVSPTLQPIWAFFVALCQTLQQGEDEFLTADDAYWLGLIDEIIGVDGLVHMRLIAETAADTSAASTAAAPTSTSSS